MNASISNRAGLHRHEGPAHAMNVAQLKKAFAVLLYALAAYMLWKAFAG